MLIHLAQVVTSRAPQDIDLWTNHINGAMALLEMRGPDQLNTETGLRLFMHLRYQIVRLPPQSDSLVRPLTSSYSDHQLYATRRPSPRVSLGELAVYPRPPPERGL